MLEFVFMGASIALSITLIVKLPLSNAIDDAPNHLYVIYQASVTFFAALIAFQVIFRQTNSTFDVFIEAIDRYYGSSSSDEIESRSQSSNGDIKSQSSLDGEIESHSPSTGDRHRLIESQSSSNGSYSSSNGKVEPAKDDIKTWTEFSEKEKEILLAKVALTYLTKTLDAKVNFIGTELDAAFPQTTRLNESDGSSAQPNAGGHSSPVKKKEDKEEQQGDGSSKEPSSADGHSSKDKQGGSSSGSPNAGGCFSCCCWKRAQENQTPLLEEEETPELEQQGDGSSSSTDGHSSKDKQGAWEQ